MVGVCGGSLIINLAYSHAVSAAERIAYNKSLFIIGIALLALTFTSQPVSAQGLSDMPAVEANSSTASALSPLLLEYPITGSPTRIKAENAGRVWVTLPQLDAIGSISVTELSSAGTSYIFRTYPLAAGSRPYALAVRGSAIWFTAYGHNQIGRLDAVTKDIQLFPIPEVNSGPAGIAVAPNGEIWFTLQVANKLGRFNPQTNAFLIYDYPFPNSGLDEVAVVRSDSIWFTAPDANRIVNYDVTRSRFVNISTLPYSNPTGLAVDTSDKPWVSVTSDNRIGRYAPGTLAFWRWQPLPSPNNAVNGGPHRIALTGGVGPWRLFYVNQTTQRVGLVNIANDTSVGTIRETVAPAGCQLLDIAVTDVRDAWFTCGTRQSVIRWISPFALSLYAPMISR